MNRKYYYFFLAAVVAVLSISIVAINQEKEKEQAEARNEVINLLNDAWASAGKEDVSLRTGLVRNISKKYGIDLEELWSSEEELRDLEKRGYEAEIEKALMILQESSDKEWVKKDMKDWAMKYARKANYTPEEIEILYSRIFEAAIGDMNKTPVTDADYDEPYPEPNYMPSQRSPDYKLNKNHDIWRPEDPTIFITPDNEWVKYYASQLYVEYDGSIRYKDTMVPRLSDEKGNVLSWINKPFINNYVSDDEQFNYPPNGDVWVWPEYYLTNGMMSDDCDGWAVTVESLMLSGEMSLKEKDGTFKKQKIPAKAILGYTDKDRFRDLWVEYRAYGKTFITSTGLMKDSGVSFTLFEEKHLRSWDSVFKFDDKSFGPYEAWN